MAFDEQNRLSDELGLRNLEARYCDAVIRRDADAWESTWALDGVWEFMGQTIEGRNNIVTLWKQAMDDFPMIIHHYLSGGINIDGDNASCRWYINEMVINTMGEALHFFGVYNDQCRKIENEWLFKKRRFDLIYQGPGLLDDAGWLGYPRDLDRPI